MKTKIFNSAAFYFFVILLVLALGSCKNAKLPGTDITITGRIALEKLEPPQGKALVYFIRNKSLGMPGKHLIVSRGENVSELPIQLEAGKTYFIQQKPKMGLFALRSKLIRLEEEEAKRYLSYCRLSKTNITFEGF